MDGITFRREKIIINNQTGLKEWCELLDCTEEDLLKAIQEIGDSAGAVDDYLVLNRRKLASGMDL